MASYVLSSAAAADIESILDWAEEHFGLVAKRRYAALLVQAIHDVAEKPNRAGSQTRPEMRPNARTYHLRHSRTRVAASTGIVKKPRHLLIYRSSPGLPLEIARVVHERMELANHLPKDYRSS
jgi:toxin ParE1/3/4